MAESVLEMLGLGFRICFRFYGWFRASDLVPKDLFSLSLGARNLVQS